MTLLDQLTGILNAACAENESNTPDFILANYLLGSLEAFNTAVNMREKWYGRGDFEVADAMLAARAKETNDGKHPD